MRGGRPGGDAGRARDTGRGCGPGPAAGLVLALHGTLIAPDGALVVASGAIVGGAVIDASAVGRTVVGHALASRAVVAGSACGRRGAVPVAGRGGIGVQAVRLGALLLEGAALLVDLLALRLGLAPATLGGELLLLGRVRLALGLETGLVGLDLGLAGLQIALLDGLLLLGGLLADLRGAASILLLLSLLATLRGFRAHDDQDDDDDQDQQDDPDDHGGGQVGHGRLLTARLLHRRAAERAPDRGSRHRAMPRFHQTETDPEGFSTSRSARRVPPSRRRARPERGGGAVVRPCR